MCIAVARIPQTIAFPQAIAAKFSSIHGLNFTCGLSLSKSYAAWDTSPRLLPRFFIMPYCQPSKSSLPITLLKDVKSQKCGLRHTIFSPSGNEYTGEWLDDKKHGSGTQVWKKTGAIYDGKWEAGKPDGYGTYGVRLQESKGYTRKYSGEWKSGKKHGYGTYFYNNSSVYEGEWSENQRSGWGRMYYENGDIYEGEWMEDKNHGQGVMRFSNGNWYEGNWQDGKRSGDGRFCYANKGLLYEGFWVDGVAKCGTMFDLGRDKAPAPPKYPFPKIQLKDVELVLREAKSAYQDQRC